MFSWYKNSFLNIQTKCIFLIKNVGFFSKKCKKVKNLSDVWIIQLGHFTKFFQDFDLEAKISTILN